MLLSVSYPYDLDMVIRSLLDAFHTRTRGRKGTLEIPTT